MKTSPDYGVSQTQLGSPDIDLAELAARTSIDTFRRSGRVIYLDPCDSVAPWITGGSSGWNVSPDPAFSYMGPNSIRLTPGTSPPATYDATMIKTIPALGLTTNLNTKIGIEFYFSAEYIEAASPAFLEVSCLFDPILAAQASFNKLRFVMADGSLMYFNGMTEVTIPGITLPYNCPGQVTWHNLKILYSFGRYYGLFFDGANIPFDLTVTPGATSGFSTTQIKFLWRDINGSRLWLDNIILTIDEA